MSRPWSRYTPSDAAAGADQVGDGVVRRQPVARSAACRSAAIPAMCRSTTLSRSVEVAVEGGASEARRLHHVLDREIPERPALEKVLGGVEDRLLGRRTAQLRRGTALGSGCGSASAPSRAARCCSPAAAHRWRVAERVVEPEGVVLGHHEQLLELHADAVAADVRLDSPDARGGREGGERAVIPHREARPSSSRGRARRPGAPRPLRCRSRGGAKVGRGSPRAGRRGGRGPGRDSAGGSSASRAGASRASSSRSRSASASPDADALEKEGADAGQSPVEVVERDVGADAARVADVRGRCRGRRARRSSDQGDTPSASVVAGREEGGDCARRRRRRGPRPPTAASGAQSAPSSVRRPNKAKGWWNTCTTSWRACADSMSRQTSTSVIPTKSWDSTVWAMS